MKRMKIPRKISIKGGDYQVKVLPRSEMPNYVLGDCDPHARIIRLTKEDPKIDKTFIHECIHGLTEETGMNQAHVSDDFFEMLSENVSTWICDKFDLRLKVTRRANVAKAQPKKGSKKSGKKSC